MPIAGKSKADRTLGAGLAWLAVLLSAAIVYRIGVSQGVQSERHGNASHQHADSAKAHAKRSCVGVDAAATFECIYEYVEAGEEAARAEQDLSAQQSMALWALIMVVVNVLTSGIALAALLYVRQTMFETQGMVREARRGTRVALIGAKAAKQGAAETSRIGEAQVRAYLTGVSATLAFDPEGGVIISCLVENAGQSPARGVSCAATVEFVGADGPIVCSGLYEDIGTFSIDVPAGVAEQIEVYVPGDMLSWIETDGLWHVSAHVEISGTDVFGSPIEEDQRFHAFFRERPGLEDRIEMKRAGRFEREGDQQLQHRGSPGL